MRERENLSAAHIELRLSVKTWDVSIFSFGEEELVVPLIATPNVDNANRRQEKDKN
jgi:hypothetical protein